MVRHFLQSLEESPIFSVGFLPPFLGEVDLPFRRSKKVNRRIFENDAFPPQATQYERFYPWFEQKRLSSKEFVPIGAQYFQVLVLNTETSKDRNSCPFDLDAFLKKTLNLLLQNPLSDPGAHIVAEKERDEGEKYKGEANDQENKIDRTFSQ